MKLTYGESSFEKIRTRGFHYVDKTRYIELLETAQQSHVIMLRPRRFGKTLFCNMLGYYYDRRHESRFDELFGGTYIHDNPTSNRGNYLILTFNFSGINTETLKKANQGFGNVVKGSIGLSSQTLVRTTNR